MATTAWLDGKLLPYEEAKVELLTHSLHYATAVFEGIRAYETGKGPAIFRCREHVARLFTSAKLVSLPLPPFSQEEVCKAIKAVVKANGLRAAYIRPLIFTGAETLGLHLDKLSPHLAILALPFPTYLGEAKEKGARVTLLGPKIPSSAIPQQAKAAANYLAGSIFSKKARRAGFDEALLLNIHGRIAEGPGENVFMVKDSGLTTPPLSEDVLGGITRDTIITLAREEGYTVEERPLSVGEFLAADEAFFTGTAAEVVPIIEVDGIPMGKGRPGPITKHLQSLYEKIVRGEGEERGWLTFVE